MTMKSAVLLLTLSLAIATQMSADTLAFYPGDAFGAPEYSTDDFQSTSNPDLGQPTFFYDYSNAWVAPMVPVNTPEPGSIELLVMLSGLLGMVVLRKRVAV